MDSESEPKTYTRRSPWTDLGDDKRVPAVREKIEKEKEKEKEGAGWLCRRRIVSAARGDAARGSLLAGWAEPAWFGPPASDKRVTKHMEL
jgi:hypothetical protein